MAGADGCSGDTTSTSRVPTAPPTTSTATSTLYLQVVPQVGYVGFAHGDLASFAAALGDVLDQQQISYSTIWFGQAPRHPLLPVDKIDDLLGAITLIYSAPERAVEAINWVQALGEASLEIFALDFWAESMTPTINDMLRPEEATINACVSAAQQDVGTDVYKAFNGHGIKLDYFMTGHTSGTTPALVIAITGLGRLPTGSLGLPELLCYRYVPPVTALGILDMPEYFDGYTQTSTYDYPDNLKVSATNDPGLDVYWSTQPTPGGPSSPPGPSSSPTTTTPTPAVSVPAPGSLLGAWVHEWSAATPGGMPIARAVTFTITTITPIRGMAAGSVLSGTFAYNGDGLLQPTASGSVQGELRGRAVVLSGVAQSGGSLSVKFVGQLGSPFDPSAVNAMWGTLTINGSSQSADFYTMP